MVSKYQITGILQKNGRNNDLSKQKQQFNSDRHGNAAKFTDLEQKQRQKSGAPAAKKTDSVQRLDGIMSSARLSHDQFLNSLGK